MELDHALFPFMRSYHDLTIITRFNMSALTLDTVTGEDSLQDGAFQSGFYKDGTIVAKKDSRKSPVQSDNHGTGPSTSTTAPAGNENMSTQKPHRAKALVAEAVSGQVPRSGEAQDKSMSNPKGTEKTVNVPFNQPSGPNAESAGVVDHASSAVLSTSGPNVATSSLSLAKMGISLSNNRQARSSTTTLRLPSQRNAAREAINRVASGQSTTQQSSSASTTIASSTSGLSSASSTTSSTLSSSMQPSTIVNPFGSQDTTHLPASTTRLSSKRALMLQSKAEAIAQSTEKSLPINTTTTTFKSGTTNTLVSAQPSIRTIQQPSTSRIAAIVSSSGETAEAHPINKTEVHIGVSDTSRLPNVTEIEVKTRSDIANTGDREREASHMTDTQSPVKSGPLTAPEIILINPSIPSTPLTMRTSAHVTPSSAPQKTLGETAETFAVPAVPNATTSSPSSSEVISTTYVTLKDAATFSSTSSSSITYSPSTSLVDLGLSADMYDATTNSNPRRISNISERSSTSTHSSERSDRTEKSQPISEASASTGMTDGSTDKPRVKSLTNAYNKRRTQSEDQFTSTDDELSIYKNKVQSGNKPGITQLQLKQQYLSNSIESVPSLCGRLAVLRQDLARIFGEVRHIHIYI